MKKIAFMCISALVFAACSARINGSLQSGGQASLAVYAALEPRMEALIKNLAAASGPAQPGAPLLDGASIAASMAKAPGIEAVSFKNVTPSAIEGTVKITNIGDFLSASRKQGAKNLNFIHFEQGAGGGRCTINLSRDSGPEILALISPEIADYFSALMAPLATGEVLTKTEYRSLVESVYGKGIADEIAKASIRVSLDFPGQVQSVKGGTFSGKRAEFNIPLPDILVLETPLNYEVAWK